MICFKYMRFTSLGVEHEWCTPSNDPVAPPVDPPAPPPGWPIAWGDEPGFQVFPTGLGGPCCYSGFHGDPVYDDGIGQWGGWRWILTDEECPDQEVEVYPIAWEGTEVSWFVKSVVGGVPNLLSANTTIEGEWPVFTFGVGAWTPCPESAGILIPFG